MLRSAPESFRQGAYPGLAYRFRVAASLLPTLQLPPIRDQNLELYEGTNTMSKASDGQELNIQEKTLSPASDCKQFRASDLKEIARRC